MDRAIRFWVIGEADRHPGLLRFGYFGSYARGDWGVGSDLDLVAIVRSVDAPFGRRALTWDLNALPVAADLLVYTETEWRRLMGEGSRFARTLEREAVWVYPALAVTSRPPASSPPCISPR